MALPDLRREPHALLAEDQHRPRGIGDAPVVAIRLGAEEERLAQVRELRLERAPGRPDARRDARPVVQPGAAHLALGEEEAQRPDEVQPRPGGQARAAGVAGVPVDLRLDEDDEEGGGDWIHTEVADGALFPRNRLSTPSV